MRYAEFVERFGDLEREEFETRFNHPFLLENVELMSDERQARRVFLVRGSKGMPLLVGRGPRCHIPVRDPLVSTKHAELLPPEAAGAGEWHIVDLGSTNKTFLSGRELEPDFPAPVVDRAALTFGPAAHFTFLLSGSFFELLKEQLSHTPEPLEPTCPTDLLGTIPYGELSQPKGPRKVVDPTQEVGSELLVFCEPLDPIPLDVGQAMVVGRSPNSADLVLQHKHISRRHTEIQRLPHGVFARDMGSSNGTLLDGEKLPTDWTQLPIGAVLVIGPYRVYVAGPQSSGTDMHNLGGTLVVGGKKGTEGIEGALSDMPLDVVLQEIETEQHTGMLELSGATITGRLTFLNGHPREAMTDDGLAGSEAVLRLLKETSGTYLLRPTHDVGSAQIERTFSELLLERFLSEA